MELINKEEFDALPKNKKIVAICRDVLARLDAELISPHTGVFWGDNKLFVIDNYESPKECFNQKSCEVCAKGAIFSSWVGNFNNLNWDQTWGIDEDTSSMPKDLVKIFGKTLLDKIETAFEGQRFSWTSSLVSLKYAYLYTGKSYKGRLRAIMENIIENDGDFVISK